MGRALRILAWTAGSLVVLLVVAVGALYLLTGSAWFRDQVAGRASTALGRETRIGGLDIDWGRVTDIHLRDVFIANSDWAERDGMLEAEAIDASIRLWPLLRGSVELPRLRLVKPRIAVETNAEGVNNWSFGENPGAAAAAETAAPDERDEMPAIGELDIEDGSLLYRDVPRDVHLEGQLRSASGEAAETRQVRLEADGQLAGKPLTVRFVGGSVLSLRDEDKPYPVDLDTRYGRTELSVRGAVVDPLKFASGSVTLRLKGPDLSDVFPILGIPAPPTPPYELTMGLSRDGEVWHATDLNGRVGDSDLSGDVTVDYGRERPFLKAALRSKRLDFDDLGPLLGLPPRTGETASAEQVANAQALQQSKKLFPDQPLNMAPLRAMDMDVTLDAATVEGDGLPIDSLHTRVVVDNGRAEAKPLKIGVGGGLIEGEMVLNARDKVPSAAARLAFHDIELRKFFQDSTFIDQMGGKFNGRFVILGSGNSLAQIMATSRGNAAIVMREGSMSRLLIEGANLDIAEALVILVTEDGRVPIRCGGGRFAIEKGIMTTDRFILDTTDSVIYLKGSIDLQQQNLDLDIDAQAKDFSLLDLKSTVAIKGPLGDPGLALGRGAPIPFLEFGRAKDIDCDWLTGTALQE